MPPPTARLGIGCWEVRGLDHFHMLVGGYRMPAIIVPLPPTLFSHHGEVIRDYRGVGLLGSLKSHHPSLPTFQGSPILCLSLVPMFTVEVAGRSGEK